MIGHAAEPLLDIRDLSITFPVNGVSIPIVEGLNFSIAPGETLSIVGESGSGKSLTALAILGLLPKSAKISSGAILFRGEDMLLHPEQLLSTIRGQAISMIFQEPMSSLNPVLSVGHQIMEPLFHHRNMARADARKAALELLERVEIPDARRRIDDYPHQLSGGTRQRVMIAIALACRPHLLIADEPTTALDVTIQAQILDLLRSLQRDLHMSVLLITHDLGVVAEFSDRVLVMYAGRAAETASAQQIFSAPQHPYTRGLLASVPDFAAGDGPMMPIGGTIPPINDMPPGCRFAPRCSLQIARCSAAPPPMQILAPGHACACIMPYQDSGSVS